MKYYFHPEAEAEFDGAVAYYEQCQPGLGMEFAEEVFAAITRISEYPDACALISTNARRCLVNRFPYGIIYQVHRDTLRIIAVANLHRRPGYWKARARQGDLSSQS